MSVTSQNSSNNSTGTNWYLWAALIIGGGGILPFLNWWNQYKAGDICSITKTEITKTLDQLELKKVTIKKTGSTTELMTDSILLEQKIWDLRQELKKNKCN